MSEIIIIAGPNGAGKSSFAEQFLRDEEGIAFVNADEIARLVDCRAKGAMCALRV
jgi:predicted ABC-type ATPase